MLTLCSNELKTSEVRLVLIGKSVIRIPFSKFRPGTSSTNFYKATENPNSDSSKNQHSDHCLHGWYALNESSKRRPEHGRGYFDFSLTAIGVHNKSEKKQQKKQYCRQHRN